MNIPYFTTIPAALAVCDAIEAARGDEHVRVRSLQEWGALAASGPPHVLRA